MGTDGQLFGHATFSTHSIRISLTSILTSTWSKGLFVNDDVIFLGGGDRGGKPENYDHYIN